VQLQPRHRCDEEVIAGELQADRPRRHLPDAADRVERSKRPEVIVPVARDLPERQEPIAPARCGGDEHGGHDPRILGGKRDAMHGTEVVAHQTDPAGLDVRAFGQEIDRGSVPLDLGADPVRIGRGVARGAGPGELALRQNRHHAVVARQVDRLVDELRAIAIGRLGVEPVQEEDGRTPTTIDRFDHVGLGARNAQVMDARAIALGECRIGHRFSCRGC
jgi:hypothetical protein